MKKNNIKNGSAPKPVKNSLPKCKTVAELADIALQPLIEHCTATRGAKAEVVRLFNDGLKEPLRSTTIYRWLDEDKAVRIEPTLGSGLRLLQVWDEIKDNLPIGNPLKTVTNSERN